MKEMQNRLRESKTIYLILIIFLCSCANSPIQDTACLAQSEFTMSEFPFTHDAFNINQPLKGESFHFSSKLSITKIVEFYRNQFRLREFCEDPVLETITQSTFSIVFIDLNNKKIVLQGVDFAYSSDNNSRIISVRIE